MLSIKVIRKAENLTDDPVKRKRNSGFSQQVVLCRTIGVIVILALNLLPWSSALFKLSGKQSEGKR